MHQNPDEIRKFVTLQFLGLSEKSIGRRIVGDRKTMEEFESFEGAELVGKSSKDNGPPTLQALRLRAPCGDYVLLLCHAETSEPPLLIKLKCQVPSAKYGSENTAH
ncbi:hypothetical protein M5D96_001515 [Drosophila gunungcola]|uniref:Uncharacterized protein n=1 Tax=Drosophila gunungcola TaxID=103775 RepID=A0A9Q0BVE1_9MUSC|nr:hypothetical protein M5D96_001515 [Drosophila gunungcola]